MDRAVGRSRIDDDVSSRPCNGCPFYACCKTSLVACEKFFVWVHERDPSYRSRNGARLTVANAEQKPNFKFYKRLFLFERKSRRAAV